VFGLLGIHVYINSELEIEAHLCEFMCDVTMSRLAGLSLILLLAAATTNVSI